MKARRLQGIGLAVLSFLGFEGVSLAGAVTIVPPGLNPGDHYRLVFVTSTARDATEWWDITRYDDFVNSAANAPGSLLAAYGLSWKVVGSTYYDSARDHIGAFGAVPVFRLDGVQVASGEADFWDGTLQAAISIDEHGNSAPRFQFVWTGTRDDGSSDWFPLGGGAKQIVTAGGVDYTDYRWIAGFGDGRDQALPFYAISGDLTVPGVVPEPRTTAVMSAGILLLILARYRRRSRRP